MVLAASVAAVVVVFLGYTGFLNGNFRTVTDDHMYRSAQLSPETLKGRIEQHGIKTVLNLRGPQDDDDAWYQAEKKTCIESGVRLVDLKLDPEKLPHPDVLRALLDEFENQASPALMHCRAGADRSGLAAALYLMIHEGKSLDQAYASTLTWHQGRLIVSAKNDSPERFFELYRKTGKGVAIKDWILNQYPAIFAKIGPRGTASQLIARP
jgi:protein tyrosine phosphatase (PTP) superfamily phosphohydrolase (DUF442 family)